MRNSELCTVDSNQALRHSGAHCFTERSIQWSTEWLTGGLIQWLSEMFTEWMTEWSAAWLTERLTEWLPEWNGSIVTLKKDT